MLARGASNTKKCLLHFIAACHEDLQNSRTAYEIQLHLTRVTTTTNTKKILCCPTKHHDIETPLLRCHHKYTESVLSHHPPRARESRVGVMNTSHQAETADGIQFTFSLKPCETSKQWFQRLRCKLLRCKLLRCKLFQCYRLQVPQVSSW